MNITLALAVLAIFFILFLFKGALGLKPGQVKKERNGIILRLPNGFLSVGFCSDSIVRVAFAEKRNFFSRKSIVVPESAVIFTDWTLETTSSTLTLCAPKLLVSVDRSQGTIKFMDEKGQ